MKNNKSSRRVLAVCLASTLTIVGLTLSTQLGGTAKSQEVAPVVAVLTPPVAPMTRTAPLAADQGKEAVGEDRGANAKVVDQDRIGVSEHVHSKPQEEKPSVNEKPAAKSMGVDNNIESTSGHSAHVRLSGRTESSITSDNKSVNVSTKTVEASTKVAEQPKKESLKGENESKAAEATVTPEAPCEQADPKNAPVAVESKEVIEEVTLSVLAEPSTSVDCYQEKRGKNTYEVARTIIKATPAQVFDVLTDYSKVDAIFDNLTRCEVVEDNGSSKKVSFTAKSMGGLWKFDYVLELKESAPNLIEWTRVSGAFKANEGYWKLEPVNGGKYTQVTYSKFIDGGILLPQRLVQKELKALAPGIMKNLRTAAERYNVASK